MDLNPRMICLLSCLATAACGEAADVDLAAVDGTVSVGDAEISGDGATLADAGVQNPDWQDPTCTEPDWMAAECGPGMATTSENMGGQHIEDGTPIVYTENPPLSGSHRGSWARWGEYSYLPPQRWLHNLEHGGAALLYHPCISADMKAELDAYIDTFEADYRWVLTPYPGLESAIAVVTWQWGWSGPCVRTGEMDAFLAQHYRDAPEDVASDGSYSEGWIGR